MVTMYTCTLNTYFVLCDRDTGFNVIDGHPSVFVHIAIKFVLVSLVIYFIIWFHSTFIALNLEYKNHLNWAYAYA